MIEIRSEFMKRFRFIDGILVYQRVVLHSVYQRVVLHFALIKKDNTTRRKKQRQLLLISFHR